MAEPVLTCPECGSDRVTTAHIQTFMVNTGEHFCHSVKTHDSDSPATCLACWWKGERKDLKEKTMTEPTDAELDEIYRSTFLAMPNVARQPPQTVPPMVRDFARAVLAKWCQPPAVAGEPVAWQYQSGDGLWHNFIDARHYKNTVDSGEWPIRALYTTPQPTQAQAEKCAVCGDGNARLVVMRSCDVCGSDYAGQSESEVNVALERARKATQTQAGAVPLTTETDCGGESCDCRSYCKKKGGQHGAE